MFYINSVLYELPYKIQFDANFIREIILEDSYDDIQILINS